MTTGDHDELMGMHLEEIQEAADVAAAAPYQGSSCPACPASRLFTPNKLKRRMFYQFASLLSCISLQSFGHAEFTYIG
jgi:hypothetical protein